ADNRSRAAARQRAGPGRSSSVSAVTDASARKPVDPRRYFENVEARAIAPAQAPVCLYLETTNRCNLLCTTCPRTYAELEPPADMSWELFTAIIDQLPEIERAVLHGVGEPMLVKALPKMVRYLKDRGVYVLFNTNGTVLNERNGRARARRRTPRGRCGGGRGRSCTSPPMDARSPAASLLSPSAAMRTTPWAMPRSSRCAKPGTPRPTSHAGRRSFPTRPPPPAPIAACAGACDLTSVAVMPGTAVN